MAKNTEATYTVAKLEGEAFDKRLSARHINEGRITREELAGHLASLPDYAHDAMRAHATLVETRRRGPKVSELSED